MTDNNSNKRILKNSIVLYARMLFILAVNLYASRIVLSVLGVNDYGVYNVVAGFVMMFGFLNSAMSTASSRYITYEQGRGSFQRQVQVFSSTVIIHVVLAFVVVILVEASGGWYITHKMVIPVNRLIASRYVFQSAVISLFFLVITVPLSSTVIAHEDMGMYAFVSILDALLKLVVVIILPFVSIDRLILYAALLSFISFINFIVYLVYCRIKFAECRFTKRIDPSLLSEMLGFAGWSFFGNMGISAKDYGVNLVLNLFFGPAINASRGLAIQISSAVNGFVSNFQMALTPQITKRYAANERHSMVKMVFVGARMSFSLLAIVVLPIIVRADYLLDLWLVNVPAYAVVFLRLVLVMALVNSMYGPISTAVLSTGNIKWYQIIVSLVLVMDVPLSFYLIKAFNTPIVAFIVGIVSAFVALLVRAYILSQRIDFSFKSFVYGVVVKNSFLFLGLYCASKLIDSAFSKTFYGTVCEFVLLLTLSVVVFYYFGLNKSERLLIQNIIRIKQS